MRKKKSLKLIKELGEKLYYLSPPTDMALQRGYFYQQTKDIQKRYYRHARQVLNKIEEISNM